jgi:hypothetical protein
MNARSRPSDKSEHDDPEGTLDTVPPPNGARDPYSAQTRVAPLPESVLAAMREHGVDGHTRTRSGMRAVVRPPLAPPRLPTIEPIDTFDMDDAFVPTQAFELPEPPIPEMPASRRPVPHATIPRLPAPSPLAPLALTAEEAWSATPAPEPRRSSPVPLAPTATPVSSVGLLGSVAVVAVFALLGAAVAALITLAGY